jgi:head-tail adaptor
MQCGKYSAGMLREVVAIQQASQASDGQGGYTETWAAVSGAPTRAMITAAPGSERWGFMRQTPGNTYKMVTRGFATPTAAQRVMWKSKEYAVLGVVDPDGRGDWLEWRLSDGVAS